MPVGSTVTFTYVVTNTGDVPLANVVVTDDKLGAHRRPRERRRQQQRPARPDRDLDLHADRHRAGRPVDQRRHRHRREQRHAVTDTNPDNHFGDAAGIRLVKLTNGQDADTPTGPHVPVGSTVTFTYVVTNTGNVPLADVAVTDDKLGPIAGPSSAATPTATACSTSPRPGPSRRPPPPLAGQYTNTGTVTGTPAAGPPVTDSNPDNHFGDAPAIHLVKLVNGQDDDTATGPHVAVGSTVTFTYLVTNTGNVPLANVVVADDKLGTIAGFIGDANANGLLDLTETWTYTKTATAVAGQQTNVGTVTAQTHPPGPTVTDSNPANYFGGAPASAQIPTLSPLATVLLASMLALVAALLLSRGTNS